MKKIGRNTKCFCGSGKKYKHCCLIKSSDKPTTKNTYVLAADLSINLDNIEVRNLNVEGNINLNKSKNAKLIQNMITKSKDNIMSGNINIKDDNEFSLDKNVVEGDINIGSRNKFILTKNVVGHKFEYDDVIIEALNILFQDETNKETVERALITLQDKVLSNTQAKERLSEIIVNEDKKSDGALSKVIFKNLKKLGIKSIEHTTNFAYGEILKWIISLTLNNNL